MTVCNNGKLVTTDLCRNVTMIVLMKKQSGIVQYVEHSICQWTVN